MGEGGESRAGEARIDTVGAIRITPVTSGVELYFPPLRATGSALTLALFGAACSIIGLAAIAGLAFSGESAAASMLALAFAGVFALPLFALGQVFIVVAAWTAANSLHVEVSSAGLRIVRNLFGFTIGRRAVARADVVAIESRLAAKYIGAFGATRYYRLVVSARGVARPLLIADSLKGPAMTEEIRQLVIAHLAAPGLAAAGVQAHITGEQPA